MARDEKRRLVFAYNKQEWDIASYSFEVDSGWMYERIQYIETSRLSCFDIRVGCSADISTDATNEKEG